MPTLLEWAFGVSDCADLAQRRGATTWCGSAQIRGFVDDCPQIAKLRCHTRWVKHLALALLILTACGRDSGDIDSFIGASCGRDSDCDERCYQDPDSFPGGFCSIACRSDADCPSDTACIEKAGGVCLYLCSEVDCSRLGFPYQCKDKDHVSGGKAFVCIGD